MTGPENNHLTKNWLVKSSTKILGPFSRDEVMSLLTRRQITIIDEVRQPEGRWNYIRENRHFKEIVKSLRYEQDHSREDTMTSTATIGSLTMTKTEAPVVADEFTPTPVTPPKAPPSHAMKDVTPSENQPTATSSGGSTKSYGNMADRRVRIQMQKQNTFLRGVLLTITAAAIVFVAFSFLRKEKKSDLNYEQLLSSAIRYKEMGLYEAALKNYKKAASIREPDLESQFRLVFLLINEDRQSLNGRRVIERALLREGRTRGEIIDGHLGMALSYMMEGDLRQAEDYLQKTLGYDANNNSAKINQAVILLKKGNYAQALKSFEALSKPEAPSYPLILLCKAMALIEVSKAQTNKEDLIKVSSEIRGYITRSHFLRKELSMLGIYLNSLAQDPEGELASVNAFLEEPHSLSRRYARDLTIDWRNSEWDFLDRYCSELYNANQGTVVMKAVRAGCLIESNRDMEAVKLIDEAVAQAPKDLTSLQAQADYLWKLGRTKEAQILFQNTDYRQTRLALYVQGESCLTSKDWSCAEAAYKILSERDFSDVLAHYGLAQVALARKDMARVQNEIKSGFEAESNYMPLIELRDQVESR